MPAKGAREMPRRCSGTCASRWCSRWPLLAHLGDALPGPIGGDTGVYVWNLWVFRHEIVEHGRFPFLTSEILALTQGAPLTLHNYTSLANVMAFPLLPLIGTVATFNLLLIASGVISAFAAFVFFRARCRATRPRPG